MGMVHEISLIRIRILLAGMTLAIIALVACLMGTFSAKTEEAKPNDCWNTSRRRVMPLSDSTLADLFLQPTTTPSRAFVFLAAINSLENGTGLLQWEEPKEIRSKVSLDKDRRKILVQEQGFYLVFVQATFRLPRGTAASLQLGVYLDLEYQERTDQLSAVFDSRCRTALCDDETDAVLSQPILLRIERNDWLSVRATHRELMDYEHRPVSSFLTVFKFSD